MHFCQWLIIFCFEGQRGTEVTKVSAYCNDFIFSWFLSLKPDFFQWCLSLLYIPQMLVSLSFCPLPLAMWHHQLLKLLTSAFSLLSLSSSISRHWEKTFTNTVQTSLQTDLAEQNTCSLEIIEIAKWKSSLQLRVDSSIFLVVNCFFLSSSIETEG